MENGLIFFAMTRVLLMIFPLSYKNRVLKRRGLERPWRLTKGRPTVPICSIRECWWSVGWAHAMERGTPFISLSFIYLYFYLPHCWVLNTFLHVSMPWTKLGSATLNLRPREIRRKRPRLLKLPLGFLLILPPEQQIVLVQPLARNVVWLISLMISHLSTSEGPKRGRYKEAFISNQ